MPLFEYKCPQCLYVSEHMSTVSERKKPRNCKKCGSEASFITSAPTVSLDGTDPGFPGEYDKWARLHENHGKHI